MGDAVAAEAHLNGLFTLIDVRKPEEWQHRFYGLLQRVILLYVGLTWGFVCHADNLSRAGSYIAASKCAENKTARQLTADEPTLDPHEQLMPQFSRSPSPTFSSVPFIATRLSPFYFGSTPGLEACKADAEGQVLVNALRRLSAQPVIGHPTLTANSSRSNSSGPDSPGKGSRGNTPPFPLETPANFRLSKEATSVLLADTESYIASLLFKPQPIYRDLHVPPPPTSSANLTPQQRCASRSVSPAIATATTFGGGTPIPDDTPIAYSHASTPAGYTSTPTPTPRQDPYSGLPATIFPSASRAWATAAYLYLHVILASLWETSPYPHPQPFHYREGKGKRKRSGSTTIADVDPHLLRLLLDTLRADIEHTEGAMAIGAYSSELWIWKVLVGAYVVEAAGTGYTHREEKATGRAKGRRRGKRHGQHQQQQNTIFGLMVGEPAVTATAVHDSEYSNSESGNEGQPENMELELDLAQDIEEETLKAWLDGRIRAWSQTSRITEWRRARQMLERIV